MNNKLKSNVLFVGLAQGGVAILSLLLSVCLTRMLAPSIFGQYALVLAINVAVVAIGTQWLTQSTNRFLPVVINKTEEIELKISIVTGLVFLCLVLIACGLLALTFVSVFWSEKVPVVIPIVAITISAATFTVGTRVLQASSAAISYGIFVFLFAILKFIFLLTALYFFGKNIIPLLWAEVLANTVLVPLLWKKSELPSLFIVIKNAYNKNAFTGTQRLWNYGGLMTGWFVGSSIMMVGDRYLIGLLRNVSEVGVYSANYNLINGSIGLAATPVLLVLHPYLMKSWAEQDVSNFGITLSNIVESIWKIGLLLVGAFCIFSHDIAYYLFPPRYVAGHLVMPIAVSGILFWNIGLYVHKPLECAEKSRALMFLSLSCAVLNTLLNIIFIPRYGYLVAAVSTTVTYFTYCVTSYIVGKRTLRWNLPLLKCFKFLMLVGSITALSLIIKNYIAAQYGGKFAIAAVLLLYVVFAGVLFWRNRKMTISGGATACSH